MAAEEHNGRSKASENPTRVDRSLDELARDLATSNVSRGRVLKIMGGALLGSVLAAVPGVAWADDDRCSEGQTRCGERCVNLQTNERHCGSCRNRCASNQTCCKGRCVNLQKNEHHCGSCSNRCPEGSECVGGECQCPSGTTLCGGNCVPNCPSGETLNPTTCECEGGLPTCPEPPCCCTCVYRDATGTQVSTCHAGVANDDLACLASCRAETPPPGTTFQGADFRCPASAGEMLVCADAQTGTGMDCGGPLPPCTPPA